MCNVIYRAIVNSVKPLNNKLKAHNLVAFYCSLNALV